MRRLQADSPSQAVRNLVTNPELVAGSADKLLYKNLITNPSFETSSGTTTVRTNLATNPAFGASSGSVTVRQNLAPNPSMEAVSAQSLTVRTNLAENPNMIASSGTTTTRTNLVLNPSLASSSTGWSVYGGGSTYATVTSTRSVATWSTSGWAWKVQGSASSVPAHAEIGAGEYSIPAGTTVTASIYVLASGTRNARIRIRGTGAGVDTYSPDFILNSSTPTRMSITYTVPAGATGFSFTIKEGSTSDSFLAADWIAASMALLEIGGSVREYFDGATPISNLCGNPSFEVNTDGWDGKGATPPTFSIDSTKSFSGKNSLKVVWNSSASQGVGYTVSGLKVGRSYTMSGYVYVPSGMANTIKSTVSSVGYGTTVVAKDIWVRSTMTWVASATSHQIGFDMSGATANGDYFYLDAVMLTDTTYALDYFEGTGDFTYAWSGTANASSSLQTALTLATFASNIANSSRVYQTYLGISGKCAYIYKGNGFSYLQYNPTGLLPATTYTLSFDVLTSSSSIMNVDRGPTGSQYFPLTKTVTPNVVTRLSRTFTTGASETTRNISIAGWETASVPEGTTALVNNVLLEVGDTVQPFFSGSSVAEADFTYSWSGTPNISSSIKTGLRVADYSYGLTVSPISSSVWKSTGSKSIRLVSSSTTTNDTFTSVSGDTGAMRLGMSAGKTYTISATCRLESPQIGSLSLRARKVVLFYKTPQAGSYSEIGSTQAPNVAGESKVSLTFTIPSDVSEAFVRLYNGSYTNSGDVWWDNLLVEETTVVKPYFDGTTPERENLAITPALAASTATTHTLNIPYAGTTWTRSTVSIGGSPLTRQYVNLDSLRQGEAYTVAVTVANDQTTSQTVKIDWADVGEKTYVIAPGEVKRLVTSGTRGYSATYRFADLSVSSSPTEVRSILFKDWLVELGQTSGDYYTGTGDFAYSWVSTPNASVSRQIASNVASIFGANEAVVFRTGSTGAYKARTVYTSGTFADSGIAFGGVFTPAATKYYSVSVDMLSDTTRTVKFSAQGPGANMGNSANLPLSAGVKVRHSWAFTTNASGDTVGLYVLRTDTGLGTIDFSNLIIEEGLGVGPYFDGTNPDKKNLAVNPSLEVNSNGWSANDATIYPAVRSTVDPISGTASFLSSRTDKSPNTSVASIWANGIDGNVTGLSVTPGDTISFSMDVKASKSNRRLTTYAAWRTPSGTTTVPPTAGITTTDLVAGTVVRGGSANIVVPADAAYLLVVANVTTTDGSNAVTGEEVRFDNLLIEKSATSSQFYAGSGDFTYAWSGTPNASTSIITAPAVAGTPGNYSGRVSWQSSQGPVAGKKSIAVLSGIPNIDTFAQLPATFPAGEILGGRTFTLLATRKTDTDFASVGSDSRAWKMLWQVNREDGGFYQVMPPIGPTVAGIHKVKYTFTFPTYVTSTAFIRVYNGSGTPGTTVWWDDVAIVEGAYTGDYFDGETIDANGFTYQWDGTVDASTSTQRAMDVKGSWTSMRVNYFSSPTEPFAGSAKVVASVTELGYFPRLISSTFTPVRGQRYTVAAKMKSNGSPVQIALAWLGSNQSTAPVQSASNGKWVKVEASGICPPDATGLQIWMGTPDGTALGTQFEIDNLMLVAEEYHGPFGSGNSYGWQWEGQPHESSSKGYPVGLTQLAGKPLTVQTLAGTYVLTNIDPVKNPNIPADAPRTIYTIVDMLQDIPTGVLDAVLSYGANHMSDDPANQVLTMRLQSMAGPMSTMVTRRTGGGGPIVQNIPSTGRQILISGITATGGTMSGLNNNPLVVDNFIVNVPHERLNIVADNIYRKHVATYIYPGHHSDAVRQEMIKLLAHEHDIPGM